MRRFSAIQLVAAAAVGILLALPAGAAHHEEEEAAAETEQPAADRKPWDQEKLTELSTQLATAVSEVRSSFRREPGFRDPSNPNRRAFNRMEQTLRGLETSTRQLRNRISGGGGYDETLGIARKIGMQLNDAEVEGRKIMTSQWLNERIRPAMDLINQVAPYYGSGPLFDPDTMQRID